MKKVILFCSCIGVLVFSNLLEAKTHKSKKSSKYNKTAYKKKRRGNGIDLKAMTNQSPYIKNSNNGINTFETTSGVN